MTNTDPWPSRFIDSDIALQQWMAGGLSDSWLAIDTEFIRERTYFPQPCLLQIAIQGEIVCIDLLNLNDLDALFSWLQTSDCEQILHSARQDLEIFFNISGRLPRQLFDTQIAAALAGHAVQIGYAGLVEALLGITLAKDQTRTDWSKRPLSAAQLKYAAEDVRYLGELRDLLAAELIAKQRMSWLEEECGYLGDKELYVVQPDQVWQRVKGINKLQGANFSAARRLAAWRERLAVKRDRPRAWVMKDALLLEIAVDRPASKDSLTRLTGISPNLVKRDGAAIIAVLEAVDNEDPDLTPTSYGLSPAARKRVDALVKQVAACAQNIDIAASLIAPKKELIKAVVGETDLRLYRGWRGRLVGLEIRAELG